ncbi:glucose-6-phosphate isomerase [uncultured Pseudoteredinibacter sp.]|uniref:glucose-6-phosphate isomerase n=1 Tax=uncultured Pseudoteredinibacter sp. TaxID=1641701 RepID=UPI00262211A3|nr:glucose-6-phosphate isomerase [uncultured Pseudoteredinibacter sp.]
MSLISKSIIWQRLAEHQADISKKSLVDLFQADPSRAQKLRIEAAGVTLDYSKNLINQQTLDLLYELVIEKNLGEQIKQLMKGGVVNCTENRQALHTSLRCDSGRENCQQKRVNTTFRRMGEFVNRVHTGDYRGSNNKFITDVVNIGIGGSHLGPMMVNEALLPYKRSSLRCHFVSNVDSSEIHHVLEDLDPESTLFIVASKTFTTTETLTNANTARQWFVDNSLADADVARHFIAVTANVENAKNFSIEESNIFPMWDWVGGRYSLWSAIGLPIALCMGMDIFDELRAGAEEMDLHFLDTPFEQNMPVIMASLSLWYINFWDAHSTAVLPYDHHLTYFTKYLQQLDMESNGKQVTNFGERVPYHTSPIIWGDVGTNGQHSFHQLLHQGTRFIPTDFIISMQAAYPMRNHHALLFANCLAQSRALMTGKTEAEAVEELIKQGLDKEDAESLAPHKAMPGSRPSNTLLLKELSPKRLGALIALYEHKTFVQSVLWDINAFDQWGVELGKELSSEIYSALCGHDFPEKTDPSTRNLIEDYRSAI